jgi:heme O synthase-like polyprenyltransferase
LAGFQVATYGRFWVATEAGPLYFAVAIMLSLGFLYYSARLAYQRSNGAARTLLMAS